MSILCLSNELLEEYLKFRFSSSFNKDVVTKLLKFIQPALASKNQSSFFDDPSVAPQLTADPIINMVAPCNEEELIRQTVLKIQLVRNKNSGANFTQLNIGASPNLECLDMLLAGEYINATNKEEALRHIKALLSDAERVKVTDRYLIENNNSWKQCKEVLEQILPKKQLAPLKIITVNFNRHRELEAICKEWGGVKAAQIGNNVHDRYIETDKLVILLSSGIFHLSPNSNTDLTYVVKVKPVFINL